MTPDEIIAAGTALYGPGFRTALAEALDVSPSAVEKWTQGKRPHAPHVTAEIVVLLRAKAAEVTALADALAEQVGNLHGLIRQEVQFIGWALSHEWIADPNFPDGWTMPRLRSAINAVLRDPNSRAAMADGEAEHLMQALANLTDGQARDVLIAARDLEELGYGLISS